MENEKYYEVEYCGGVEDFNDYYFSGFYFVFLGDFLGKSSWFWVINKLGVGVYGMVWFCRDRVMVKWRVVKIFFVKVLCLIVDIDFYEFLDYWIIVMVDMVIFKYFVKWY